MSRNFFCFWVLLTGIVGCSSNIDEQTIINVRQPDFVEIEEGTLPLYSVMFNANSTTLTTKQHADFVNDYVLQLSNKPIFILQGTAGGESQIAKEIAQHRVLEVKRILQNLGVATRAFKYLDYDSALPGLRVNIYSITYGE